MAITAILTRREVERRIAIPTVALSVVTAWLAWRGWSALRSHGPMRSIHAGQAELAGPVVLGFVLVVFLIDSPSSPSTRSTGSRTFRTHPLAHVSYVISAIPVLALASNAATPAVVLTTYACLGALPHANVRWSYGKVGKLFVSPAYHRLHHAPTGRLDINMGTVFTIWDRVTRRAVYAAPGAEVAPTGLAGRPIPVEQSPEAPHYVRTFISQWTQPFTTEQGARP